jgi:methyl-accepting chemotaxis protein
MAGEETMHVEIERPKINLPHFAAIVGGVALNAFALGGVWVNLGNTIEDLKQNQTEMSDRFDREATDRKDRQKIYQASMDGMNTQIGQIQPLQMQQSSMLEKISENKTAVVETNKRIDRVVESFGGKLDTAIESINKVATRVEVLSSKLDDAQGRTNKTLYRTPIIRP